jgi:hypothetical protein
LPYWASLIGHGVKSQRVCKPGSVLRCGRGVSGCATIHLGDALLRHSCNQPGRLAGGCHVPPLFGFAPGGVCLAAFVTKSAVRSYRTVSTWPHRNAVVLISVALSLKLLPPDVIRHRSSLEPGLSSPTVTRKRRSPNPLAWLGSRSALILQEQAHNIARHSPSITPSIFSGRKRRWNATVAARPSAMP